MGDKSDLEGRIELCEEYQGLARSLVPLVSTDKEREFLGVAVQSLDHAVEMYRCGIRGIEYTEIAEDLIRGAKEHGPPVKHPLREAIAYLFLAGFNSLRAIINLPISLRNARNYSLVAYYNISTSYNWFVIAYHEMGIRKKETKTLRLTSELDQKEARFAENLVKDGYSEQDALLIVDRPEVLVFSGINLLKERYAPEL